MGTHFGRNAKSPPPLRPPQPLRPPPAVTPTVTTVTAVDIPKRGIILMWESSLPPAAAGDHRPSSNVGIIRSDDTPLNAAARRRAGTN